MKNRYEKFILRLLNLLIIFVIIIIFIQNFQHHENIMFKNEEVFTLQKGWSYLDNNGRWRPTTLPANLDSGDDNTVTISCILPPAIHHMTSIGVLTTHQSVIAYLGNTPIYRRVIPSDTRFMNVPAGSIWDIIDLPPASHGKVLTLHFTSEYKDYAGSISEIHVGTTSSLLLYNIKTFGINFLLSIVILFNAVVLMILYFFIKWLISDNKGLLYLGCFSALASVWMMMESNLTQLFIDNAYIISSISYLSLTTFPIAILLFITTIEGFHYVKLLHHSIFIFLISDFIIILLQLTNIQDFHESQSVIQLEIALFLGIAVITLFLETFHHKNKDIKIFTISSFILFISGMMELYFHTIHKERVQGGLFQLGFLIFIIMLSWSMIRKAVDIIKLSESAKHYKYLATRDLLTNCRNRVSYAKDLERIDLSRNITLFMIDLNSMKQINDSYGHQVGDEALILSSQCLLKIFGRRIYRIGGDEFVCISYDLSLEDIHKLLSDLDAECVKSSEDIPYQISMSAGFATYDSTIDKNIYATIERADQDMYNRKHGGINKKL